MRFYQLGIAGALAGMSIFYPTNIASTETSWMQQPTHRLFIRSAHLAQDTIDRFVAQENSRFNSHDLGDFVLPEPRTPTFAYTQDRPEVKCDYSSHSSSTL